MMQKITQDIAELLAREENVRSVDSQDAPDYLNGLTERLTQLSSLLKVGFADASVVDYISHIQDSLRCLLLKHSLPPEESLDFTLTIDPTDSGFPTKKDFFLLEEDQKTASDILRVIPAREKIVEQINDAIMRGRSPLAGQVLLRKYMYYSAVKDAVIVPDFEIIKVEQVGEIPSRRKYVVEWSCIERRSNLPVHYTLFVEQDKGDRPLQKELNPFLHTMMIQTEYGLIDPRELIMRIDTEIVELHPKLIKKFVIGPYYNHKTCVSRELEMILQGVNPRSVLKFSVEGVAAESQKKVGGRLRRMFNCQIEKENYGPLIVDSRMIAPFQLKQRLGGNIDENGNYCVIYGTGRDGEIHV